MRLFESVIDKQHAVVERETHAAKVLGECLEILAPDLHIRHELAVPLIHHGEHESENPGESRP